MSVDGERRARRPWWLKTLNAAAGGLWALRLDPFPLDSNRLVDAAVRATGLDDFGGDSYREALDVLVREVNTYPGTTPFARLFMRQHLTKRLSNRLQLEAACTREPSITKQPIERPLFVLGLPRTGTTLLHRLLAVDPANRAPRMWEMDSPAPPPAPDRRANDARIRRAAKEIGTLDRIAPGFKAIHEFGAELPEECIALMANDLTSMTFLVAMSLPGYRKWLFAQDLAEIYARHRRQLQVLQARQPGRRWVLKAPFHLHGLPWLLATYPDACIVQTHRDPRSVVASTASLVATMRDAFESDVSAAAVGEEMVCDLSGWLDRAMDERARAEADPDCRVRFLDLNYADTVADPIGTVRRIYDAVSADLSAEVEQRMRSFLAHNAQHKYGKHRYSLEQYGLDPAATRERFARYCDRFDVATV